MIFNLVILLVALSAVASFVAINASSVSVSLIFWQFKDVSLAIVVLSAVAVGIILAGIVAVYQKINDHIKIRSLESKVKELERQINQRSLPLQ
ncbi:MAG: LapA family protein [Candidatus Margulisiibacteriota bacterium]